MGRLLAAASVWLGRDSDNRLFVAIDPLRGEPVAAEVRDQSRTPDRDVDARTGMPAAIQVTGGLLKSRPLTSGDYSLISTHAKDLLTPTQEMVDQLIEVLEEFKIEEGGHFDPEVDEPIEFMALWRGNEPSRTLLGYWAALSSSPEHARRIHFRSQGTWIARDATEAPRAGSVVRVHPSHWRSLTRAIDDKDVIPDAALMLLPVAPSGGGFTVRDLPAETAQDLAQAHLAHGGSPDDPLGVFIDGRAEWSSDLLLAILLDLASDRPVRLSLQPSPAAPSLETVQPEPRKDHVHLPTDDGAPVESLVEIPVAPADSSWTTLANYAIELAGTPHLLEPEACGDRDCAIFHAALALMKRSKDAEENAGLGSDPYWTQFAIRQLTDDAMRSLAHLKTPFPGLILEAPPGPFVPWYRAWVPPIREAHERTQAAFTPMLSGLYMLTYPDQAAMDLSEDALRQAGFDIPPWRDHLDDW